MFTAAVIFCLFAVVAIGKENNEVKPSKNHYHLHGQCLTGLRNQIDEEMHASLAYMGMSAYFDNNKVGRKGFAKYFLENSKEEREHAQKLIDYINRRGGEMGAFNIKMPSNYTWRSGLDAMEEALRLEESVNNKLHHLHGLAERPCKDPHLMDFLENEYLTEQVESIDEINTYVTKLRRMDSGMGEYLIDRELSGEKLEL
ncbi:ferritin heavy chain-like [Centruroides vittatus]|uniref:ferritin heavy chain-like n=1 Tax=Centruroides vittatus TaxID=120091 RepID=UPI00350EA293